METHLIDMVKLGLLYYYKWWSDNPVRLPDKTDNNQTNSSILASTASCLTRFADRRADAFVVYPSLTAMISPFAALSRHL